MDRFRIHIDGQNYESSNNHREAEYLYDTVDLTCPQNYCGEEKELIDRETSTVLKKGVIRRRR